MTQLPSIPPAQPPRAAQDSAWLRIAGLNKTFGPARVLKDVHFTARPGEVHALVGQNGSGKSTLIKILSGVYAADSAGSLHINDTPLSNPVRPQELREHGLAFVHQDLGLVDECSVLDNIRLGQFTVRPVSRRIDWRAEQAAARETLRGLHSTIDTSALVSSLEVGDRAVVAVGRALQGITPGTGCVVFDESSRALPREVLPDFYTIVRRLAQSGTAVITVSHRLDEVLALADRVTVLQDGAVVAGDRSTAGLTEQGLATLLLGRELELLEERAAGGRHSSSGRVALSARGLTSPTVKSVDLDLMAGEIVGVTGATGSGHAELPALLGGALRDAQGRIDVDGATIVLPAGPADTIKAGIALVPEDRAREGLALQLSAQDNLTLPRTRGRGRFRLSGRWQRAEFRDATRLLGVVPQAPDLRCGSFSGGNQQKLLIAKWLLNHPRVLLMHEPTQAVDVGARMDILRAVRAAADDGVCVIVSSAEPQDLAAICDRVLVMKDGTVTSVLTSAITPRAVTEAVYPAVVDVAV